MMFDIYETSHAYLATLKYNKFSSIKYNKFNSIIYTINLVQSNSNKFSSMKYNKFSSIKYNKLYKFNQIQ
jgi:hypothetical protein